MGCCILWGRSVVVLSLWKNSSTWIMPHQPFVPMSLAGKWQCKREVTKCCYIKSATVEHKRATVPGHMVKCVYCQRQNQTQHFRECFCSTVGSHLSESSLIRTPKIMIFIDILLCIKWKVNFVYYQYSITYLNISVIWTPFGPNVFG